MGLVLTEVQPSGTPDGLRPFGVFRLGTEEARDDFGSPIMNYLDALVVSDRKAFHTLSAMTREVIVQFEITRTIAGE